MTPHHAVLLCSDNPLSCDIEADFLIPSHDQYRQPQFGIADVRALIEHAHRRPDGETEVRQILVATEFVTEEAQQALLKIIEEPPLSTRFVFVIPNGYSFLPTLESRFERQGVVDEVGDSSAFVEFKAGGYAARLSAIEQATKTKDHAWQSSIKKGLLQYLKTERREISTKTLFELEFVARLLLTRGASNKFLLEHLALSLPA